MIFNAIEDLKKKNTSNWEVFTATKQSNFENLIDPGGASLLD